MIVPSNFRYIQITRKCQVIQEYGNVNCDIYIAYTVCGKVEGLICLDSAKKWFSKFLSIHITIEFQMAYESMQFTVFFCLLQLKLVVSLLQGKIVHVLIKSLINSAKFK